MRFLTSSDIFDLIFQAGYLLRRQLSRECLLILVLVTKHLVTERFRSRSPV